MSDSVVTAKSLNENQTDRDISIEQVLIKSEKIWDDTDIETNYNILKHEIYEANNFTLLKGHKEICDNHKKNEQTPFKVKNGLEDIFIKKESTGELMIKNEPDSIQIGTQSEKFLDCKPYFSTEVESVAGSTAIKSKIDEIIENNVPLKVENGLEDICVKKEITEELIIKDESDFIQTQKNTESEFPDGNLYLTEAESVDGPNKNSIFDKHTSINIRSPFFPSHLESDLYIRIDVTRPLAGHKLKKMDEQNKSIDKLEQKNKLVSARMREYRKRKHNSSQLLDYPGRMTDEMKSIRRLQIEEQNIQHRKKLNKERVKRYRERKRITALETVAQNESVTDEMKNIKKQQIEEEKVKQRRELSKERSRRYRERKRINALERVDV